MADMKKECPPGKFEFVQLDLMDLNSCVEAARAILGKGITIDVLLNNAGIMMTPFQKSKQGIEAQVWYNAGHGKAKGMLI